MYWVAYADGTTKQLGEDEYINHSTEETTARKLVQLDLRSLAPGVSMWIDIGTMRHAAIFNSITTRYVYEKPKDGSMTSPLERITTIQLALIHSENSEITDEAKITIYGRDKGPNCFQRDVGAHKDG